MRRMPTNTEPPRVRYDFADAFNAPTGAERRRILETIKTDEKRRGEYWRNRTAATLYPKPPRTRTC